MSTLRLVAWVMLYVGYLAGIDGPWIGVWFALVLVLHLPGLRDTDAPSPAAPAVEAPPPVEAPAHARTPLGRAFRRRLTGASRVEHQGAVELVSGRVGERNVTLRLGPGRDGTVLSFDLPWRAALDLDAATLPPEVAARVAACRGPDGLDDPEAALVDLFGALGCVRLQARARRAHATLSVDELAEAGAPAWAQRALAITSRLDGLLRGPIVVERAALDPAGLVCPYCRDAVADAAATPCGGCGTVHHVECFAEAGGCTVLGCSAQPRRAPRPGLRA